MNYKDCIIMLTNAGFLSKNLDALLLESLTLKDAIYIFYQVDCILKRKEDRN